MNDFIVMLRDEVWWANRRLRRAAVKLERLRTTEENQTVPAPEEAGGVETETGEASANDPPPNQGVDDHA